MEREAKTLYRGAMPKGAAHGTFFAPSLFEIDRLTRLEGEVFGPILHVILYSADRPDAVIDAVNATGYGLTLGVYSRIDHTIDHFYQRLRVGNAYVNRSMVGVRPFGGEGRREPGPRPAVHAPCTASRWNAVCR